MTYLGGDTFPAEATTLPRRDYSFAGEVPRRRYWGRGGLK